MPDSPNFLQCNDRVRGRSARDKNRHIAFGGGVPREQLVDQAKCETCHKRLALHGGSRAGDPIICTVCHNSSVGGTFGADSFGPLALGAFIHNLHASNVVPFGAVTYPQSLARCTGCHVDGKAYAARTSALPITVDAGTTLTDDAAALAWKDDLADSATAGTCKGCHTSAAAATTPCCPFVRSRLSSRPSAMAARTYPSHRSRWPRNRR